MTERTPLLHYRLVSSVDESEQPAPPAREAPEQLPGSPRQRSSQQRQQPKKLSIFFGVVIPTLLSMFSVVVFLRIGECYLLKSLHTVSVFQALNLIVNLDILAPIWKS